MSDDRGIRSDRQPAATTIAAELAALRRIVAILDKLDEGTQDRVAGWIWDRYHKPTDGPDEASWSP